MSSKPTRPSSSSSKKTTADFTIRLFPSDKGYWIQPEDWHQAMFVSWWRGNRDGMIFAVPNGGHRGKAEASRMKLTGTTAGVWDLFAPEDGIWIEMKRADRGKLSDSQWSFGERMMAAGYRCITAWGWADAVEQVNGGERESWSRPKK